VLEYIDISNVTDINKIKQILLNKEQYYLNKINPSLNVCKTADSPLGVKRDISFSTNLSKARRGKKNASPAVKVNITPKVIAIKTRLKMSERNKGVSVKVFDKKNNLIHLFPNMTSAAKYFGVDRSTISSIFRTGISYDDFTYKFEIEDTKVWVCDSKHKIVNVLGNKSKTSICYNIPYTTLSRYIKSGILYKNKYYFYIK
jgi:hypothetical protein